MGPKQALKRLIKLSRGRNCAITIHYDSWQAIKLFDAYVEAKNGCPALITSSYASVDGAFNSIKGKLEVQYGDTE